MKLPFLPPQASTQAQSVDSIFLGLLVLSIFFTALVAGIIIVAIVRYRRRSRTELGRGGGGNIKIEIGGMAFLGVLSLGMFIWAGGTYINMFNPPPDAQPIFVTGRMWMWKAQHENGVREQNTLHLEVNKPVKLILTSEDVIHDFYVPAFRIHTDVVPGRYTTQWFTPTEVGTYRLLCSQYCGTGHAFMSGEIIVMSSADYQAWIGGGAQPTTASAGAQLFQQSGCVGCHTGQPGAPGPDLQGLFGRQVKLTGGTTVTADENYIRESILNPSAAVVDGYQPIMPSFQGRLTNEEVNALVSYIKTMGPAGAGTAPETGGSASGSGGTTGAPATPAP